MTASETFELIDAHPGISVQESEYLRLLGYPRDHVLEGRPRELADWAVRWHCENGRPWIYVHYFDGIDLSENGFRIQGTSFTTKYLRDQLNLAAATSAAFVAISAGRECEQMAQQLWREGKPDEYFFMEMYGSAVVEHLVTLASGRICGWAEQNGFAVLPHYSPGYPGWDISEQAKLWQLIRSSANGAFPGELDVMNTGMLHPKKSLLAFFGITRDITKARQFQHLIPCENCSLNACQYRRTPYRRALPQTEDVRQLQPTRLSTSGQNDETELDPKPTARYTLNSRALQKWVDERLRLEALRDGSVNATFRYEGTTCSNLGLPLEFHYHVRLSPQNGTYRILGADCIPAPDDTGHTQMCEYLNDADSLIKSIVTEEPLLGRPLDEVFTWERRHSPSGCYCDADRRMHKWGLVFEVIHFALHQRKNAPANSRHHAIVVK